MLMICLCENAGKDSQRLFLEVLEVVQHSSNGKNISVTHVHCSVSHCRCELCEYNF